MRRSVWLAAMIVTCSAIIVVTLALWNAHRRREIRNEVLVSRAALARARNFHSHYEGPGPSEFIPRLISDAWIFCPSYKFEIVRYPSGVVAKTVSYDGYSYAEGERWTRISAIKDQEPVIAECTAGTENNPLGLPAGFAQMISSSEVEVNRDQRERGGELCDRFTFTVKTDEMAKRSIVETLCINREDHLPRAARFRRLDKYSESTFTYDEWNVRSEPNFPEGFREALGK